MNFLCIPPSPTGSEDCWRCKKEGKDTLAVVVIVGGVRCYYCGNDIPLCKEHFSQLKREINEWPDETTENRDSPEVI